MYILSPFRLQHSYHITSFFRRHKSEFKMVFKVSWIIETKQCLLPANSDYSMQQKLFRPKCFLVESNSYCRRQQPCQFFCISWRLRVLARQIGDVSAPIVFAVNGTFHMDGDDPAHKVYRNNIYGRKIIRRKLYHRSMNYKGTPRS